MSSKIKNALAAATVLSSVVATDVAAQENSICPNPHENSVTDVWQNSQAREASLTSGSPARQSRGQAYVSFMDSFWSQMEAQRQDSAPQTVGEMFQQIQAAFDGANQDAGQNVARVGAEPTLLISGGYNPETSWFHELELDANASLESSLVDNETLQEYLASGRGLEIGVRFSYNGDYYIQPVSYKDMFKDESITLSSPISAFQQVPEQPYSGYWDEANVTDGIACKLEM